MEVEADARPGLQQLARVFAEDLADLADRELREVGAGPRDIDGRLEVVRILFLQHVSDGVMHNRPAHQGGPHFEGLHPAILGQSGLDDRPVPLILPLGILRPGGGADHEVRLAELRVFVRQTPDVVLRPLDRRRHVIRVAQRRPRVDPADDRVDLGVAQRNVVGEFADTDRRIDMPRRHDAPHDLFTDRACPRPHLLIREKRHRRHAAGPVARLAASLQDRRDVARERRVIPAGGLGDRGGRRGSRNKQRGDGYERKRLRLH